VRKALEGAKLTTIVGDVEMRAADHQLLRPMVVVQAVKVAPGKAEVVVRSVEPAQRIMATPSPDCKM
jgi:branched-chain amino acid transport system substrate-binding protein